METNKTTETVISTTNKIKYKFHYYIQKGMSSSDALAQVAKKFGVDWDVVEDAI